MNLIAIVGDTHANSTIALCPDHVDLDDGGTYIPSNAQTWLNIKWGEYWQTVKARWAAIPKRKRGRKIVLHLGDIVESFHHGHVQLITLNESAEMDMAVKLLEPVREWADDFIVVRGTEVHSGKAAYKEELIAKRLGASKNGDRYSWWSWPGEIEGVKILAAHHPGTHDGRNWTHGGAANRAAASVIMDFAGEPLPQLAIYGHNHVTSDSGTNYPVRAIIAPCWSLKNALTHRLGKAWSLSTVGGLIVTCQEGHYNLETVTYKPEREKYWTP